jgi:hypothetical protein
MTQVAATEFFVSVSMSDLMRWQDEDDDACEPAPSLLAALKEATLTVDVKELYSRYFDEIQVGRGDAYQYQSREAAESVFAINLYRELTGQLDIVSFGMACDRAKAPIVAAHLHTFFRQASVQIMFEHSCHSMQLRKLIDLTQYPLVIEESGYAQKLITMLPD